MRNPLIASLLMLIAHSGTAQAAATDQLRGFLGRVQSLEAHFEQTLYDEKGKPLETSRGRFYLQRPGRFRWNYSEPYIQEIVADGKQVWIYDNELAQVTVRRLDDALGSTPALLLSSDEPVEKNFTLRDMGVRDGLDWVELIPTVAEASFTAVRLGFSGQELERMDLVDGFGQTTELHFSGAVHNPRLDPALFRFSVPTGVDVISDSADP